MWEVKMNVSAGQRQRTAAANPSQLIPAYVLDDLSSRFIINSREDEINSSARLFFLIENAYWFYLDFHRVESPKLKDCGMKDFAYCLINHCPLLKSYLPEFDKHYETWKHYKRSITTCGAIILDPELKYVLLVQSYMSKNSWGFPKGKINQGETSAQCAIREVVEETGFDITPYLEPDEYLLRECNEQKNVLFIIPGVSLDTSFLPKTRREIRDIQWFPLDTLPSYRGDTTLKEAIGQNLNLYTVQPYLRSVNAWVKNRQDSTTSGRGKGRQRHKVSQTISHNPSQDGAQSKKGKGVVAKNTASQQKAGVVRYSKDIIQEAKEQTVKQGRRGMTVSQTLFGNREAQAQVIKYRAPEVDTNFFYSKAWHNFSLDTDSIMALMPQEGSYYVPRSYSQQRDLLGY